MALLRVHGFPLLWICNLCTGEPVLFDTYFIRHYLLCDYLHFTTKSVIDMSHFAYACKMRYPLNLVLENIEYL